MFLGCIALLLGLFGVMKAKNSNSPSFLPSYGTAAQMKIKDDTLPMLYHDDYREKQMRGGQPPIQMRLPFGPDPLFHHIEATDLVKNDVYRMKRRQIITDLRVEPSDWRLDPMVNSCLNNYTTYQSGEANMSENINNFYFDRKFNSPSSNKYKNNKNNTWHPLGNRAVTTMA